ncbi:hypothetical protein HPP92_013674 [Vanilla planifolia]|uniref:S-adenosylmethionine decarboxylase proenzyme n=1 Tax=Vanilla planifolia TaxID=51239 RepID=A0A835QS55_VANPL|nr:hypothetical protein HPP92_013674 [Vanilla planifolia]
MSGFEGFEKRLELHFFCSDGPLGLGLRRLGSKSLDRVLSTVHCSVVSAVGNAHFDAYVLSESSLFLYPNKLIIKTCGTTALLRAVSLLLHLASSLSLYPLRCKYTRGSFIFPAAQPSPHTTFREEIIYLDQALPPSLLRHRKARILKSHSSRHSWHVYSASAVAYAVPDGPITVEICMTELDRDASELFFRRTGESNMSGHEAGKEMTRRAGISAALPAGPLTLICDFAFDPCGYSMNALEAGRYSTIHVTPEEGQSYASFECVVDEEEDIEAALSKVSAVFRAGVMSVSVSGGEEGWIEVSGMACRSRAADDFPGVGLITYQTFVVESEIEGKRREGGRNLSVESGSAMIPSSTKGCHHANT